MKAIELILNGISIILVAFVKLSRSQPIFICQSEDPLFLGDYNLSSPSSDEEVEKPKRTMDGVEVYSNANDMSFFRNKGFWYLGNLEPWPPETHYRCVEPEGCNYNELRPPTNTEGNWKANKKYHAETSIPVIQHTPCEKHEEL